MKQERLKRRLIQYNVRQCAGQPCSAEGDTWSKLLGVTMWVDTSLILWPGHVLHMWKYYSFMYGFPSWLQMLRWIYRMNSKKNFQQPEESHGSCICLRPADVGWGPRSRLVGTYWNSNEASIILSSSKAFTASCTMNFVSIIARGFNNVKSATWFIKGAKDPWRRGFWLRSIYATLQHFIASQRRAFSKRWFPTKKTATCR